MTKLYQVQAPHFTAGVILNAHGKAHVTAPILSYMKGWGSDKIKEYCKKKGWTLHEPE